MEIIATGKADRNRTVQELMGEAPRTGNKYLDLSTGNFVSIVAEAAQAPPEEPVKKNLEKKYNKEELEKMGMKELRKIGEPLGAKDTKKSELIQEILEKQ